MRTDRLSVLRSLHAQKHDHRSESHECHAVVDITQFERLVSSLWVAATAVSLRCFNFLKHMFCCKRARTTQRTHGDEVHLPALWCYTGFKASAVFVFSVSVCQWMMIQPHTTLFLPFCLQFLFSLPICTSLFCMLQDYHCNINKKIKIPSKKKKIKSHQAYI